MRSDERLGATSVRAAAHLLAVDPVGLGGAVLRGSPGPLRDAWLAAFRSALPPGAPWRRMPAGASEDRVFGGLDLAATLAAGRPVAQSGLLAEAAGGAVVVPGAERLDATVAARLAAALDGGEPTGFAAVLLDEGLGDERVAPSLGERLAFILDVATPVPPRTEADGFDVEEPITPARIGEARARLPAVAAPPDAVEAICAAGLAFGVPSLRSAVLTLRAARAAAALAGRASITPDDAALAAALVMAPRATRLPPEVADERDETGDTPHADQPREPDRPREPDQVEPGDAPARDGAASLADHVVEATRAAVPADLLAGFAAAGGDGGRQAKPDGRAGSRQAGPKRGRPVGTRRGQPGNGVRLALVDTLRAAAPWQRLRRGAQPSARILVRREDFRVVRTMSRSERVMIFAVDASGSAALHRLAEVKGAVELILAECYVRRDQVALIAFRGPGAELLLPPTRSPARAKRALAGQAGGGGTPLALAIEAAGTLAESVRRKGQAPLVVLLTDGKANIDRAGQPGRAAAEADAAAAARAFRAASLPGLVLDIAPRPSEAVRRLAAAMGTRYVALPYADARDVSDVVLAAAARDA